MNLINGGTVLRSRILVADKEITDKMFHLVGLLLLHCFFINFLVMYINDVMTVCKHSTQISILDILQT